MQDSVKAVPKTITSQASESLAIKAETQLENSDYSGEIDPLLDEKRIDSELGDNSSLTLQTYRDIEVEESAFVNLPEKISDDRINAIAFEKISPVPLNPRLKTPLSISHIRSPELLLADSDDAIESDHTGFQWTSARPDGHAPIGVMGDHTHEKGEVMFSYRYMFMDMDGNRDGTDSLSDAEVLQQFPVTPVRMTMQMHMLGVMYAPTDDLTLMAMVPYVFKEMDHVTRSGLRFTTNSEGFGDIKLTGLYKILDQNRQRLHFNIRVSFPTGSIEERDNTPAGDDQILPYPMQIGSGTFDLLPGITYLGQTNNLSWGGQAIATLRLGESSNDYRLGNQLALTGWAAYKWADWLSTSIRLNGKTWGNIDGVDSRLNPMMIPTADPDRRGGTQLNLGFGVNLYAPRGSLKGSRLAIEFELPLYRSLDGPQLETDWQLTAGIQAVF
ncbi:transporter [Coleofasciculus sp. LEGE 07092]|nr:transporter [Coleofasciculus sp. LEGE 07081]MBE9151773.1 transporter [Coleofasciculus sp. LEGE 07092]